MGRECCKLFQIGMRGESVYNHDQEFLSSDQYSNCFQHLTSICHSCAPCGLGKYLFTVLASIQVKLISVVDI